MRLSQFLQGFGPNKQKTSCVGVVVRRCGAGVRKHRFCAGVRKRRFCAGVRKRRFCVGVRKRALQRSCVKFFEMDRCARRAQGARCTHRYNSSCTHGYNSSCTHGVLGYVVRKARVETRSLLTPCQFIRDFLRRLLSLSLR